MFPRLAYVTAFILFLAGCMMTLRSSDWEIYAVAFLVMGAGSLGFAAGWEASSPEKTEW